MADILSILKFAGLAIGLASTIWALTKNTTFDDDDGRKRLTSAGHVAIALAMGSFLVAGSSQGFEVLANQAKAREAELQALSEAVRLAAADARAFRSEQREKRTLDVATILRAEALGRAAEERAADAEGRLMSIRTAMEARERDLRLSIEVNRGSSRNLSKAELALSQLERVLYPLPTVCMQIRWEIPPSAPGLKAATRRLAELARRRRIQETFQPGVSGSWSLALIEPDSSFYPDDVRIEEEFALAQALYNPRATVAFLAGPADIPKLLDQDATEILGENWLDPTAADLVFELEWENARAAVLQNIPGERDKSRYATLWYDADGSASFVLNRAKLVSESPTGRIISIPDLERATMVIQTASVFSNVMKPDVEWIRVGTRVYHPIGYEPRLRLERKQFGDLVMWAATGLPLKPDRGRTPDCPSARDSSASL